MKSRLSKPFVCSNALKSVLTPAKNEKRYRASSLTNPAKSRGFGIRMLCAPSLIIVRLFAVSAKMWYSGSAVIATSDWSGSSCGWIHASDCSTFAMRLRCVSTAPFDTPVVPPVYCRNAMSSWPSSTRSRFS